MGSKIGALKIAARRVGLSFEDYMAQIEAGLKWCNSCRSWKETGKFGNDKTRGDGLDAKCSDCRRVKVRVNTKGRTSTFKGRHHTDQAKQSLSKSSKGNKRRLGKKHAIESRIQMSQTKRERGSAVSGPKHHSYKDGKLSERLGQRASTEYKRWRFDVYARDKFTCRECGDNKGGNLNAHHIKPFADYPELRFEVSNGVTLCDDCHKLKHAK